MTASTNTLLSSDDNVKIKFNHWIGSSDIELEEPPLGEGSFGVVYRGKCRGAQVAVKVLVHQQLTEEDIRSFRSQVDIMNGIRAPNIVNFLGACCEPHHFMIITELMVMGDLDNILINKKFQISLFQRMRMAKDAASGMLWLHQNDPQILHRDLKPSNLLVEKETLAIKLCDFGLAEIKHPKLAHQSGGTHTPVGTPLWMAPEIMNCQEYTTKSDVYSFGIVLWQLLTRAEPFPDLYTKSEVFEAVGKNNRRPIMPDDVSPKLKNLIESCWDRDPDQRPSFKEIIPLVEEIIVESAIEDTEGSKFWKSHYGDRFEVPWSTFWNDLSEILPTSSINEENVDCLFKLLGAKIRSVEQIEPMVHIEQFGKLLLWFPSSLELPKPQFLDNIRNLCSRKWFFGDIETGAAAERLMGEEDGTFLVRFSKSQPGTYTLSRVDGKNISHTRIIYEKEKGKYAFDGKEYSNISELVKDSSAFCKKACPGSPFLSLFSPQHDIGYQ